ncbi:MAG: YihY/virulence factor BrkB family protein [Kiritimatiellaceae bacterium]|nr:YihY/virulence factor BrkB family protein [Kiritimatiellaceae bacterium]
MNSKPAGLVGKTQQFINQDIWELEPDSFSKARRAGLKFLRVCTLVFKGFKEDKCPIHASSLTFTTVMAMVPLLVILFAIAKGFGFEQVSGMLLEKTADMPAAFQDAVKTILTTVGSASAGALGGAGVVFFMWAAIKMLSGIEDTFNIVWGIKTPRAFIEKVRNYIVILVVAPILMIVANAGLPVIMGFAGKLTWMGPLVTFALQIIPVLVMALTFSFVYIMMPNTKVKFSYAFTGAFVSAVLTVLFQFAIIKLGVLATNANKTYGTLAAIPLFLSWVQISWQIMLLGAEVAFSIQNAGTYARERLAVNPSARSRLCLAFALMKKITAAFETGTGPFDVIAYGTANRVPVRLINDVISILAKNGLVAEAADRQGCYTLLRDPADVSARAIADAILNEGADPNELGMKDDFPMFGKITNASFQTLEKEVLKNF